MKIVFNPCSAALFFVVASSSYPEVVDATTGDTCSAPIAITPGTYSGTTAAQIDDDGFPIDSYCGYGVRISEPSYGVWYSFTSPSCAGVGIEFNTCSSSTKFDTKLSVFESGACGSMTTVEDVQDYCVGGNDDVFDGVCKLSSRYLFNPTPNTPYLLFVHGFGSQKGAFQLTYMFDCPLTHDTCSTAKTLTYEVGIVGSTEGSTLGFGESVTADLPSLTCGTKITSPAVWYTFTSGSSKGTTRVISTCTGSTFDTQVSVYTGKCGGSNLKCIGGNDDVNNAGCYYRSTFEFPHNKKTQYWVLVHGYTNPVDPKDTGAFDIMVSDASASNTNTATTSNKNKKSKIVFGESEIVVPDVWSIILEIISTLTDIASLVV